MKVYKDSFNGDELFSDSYPMKEFAVSGYPLLCEVETKQVSRSKVGNFDIGANPSAEEGGDEGADGDNDVVTVNNLVDACKLVVWNNTFGIGMRVTV
jgi:Translationally controlled tumour protein